MSAPPKTIRIFFLCFTKISACPMEAANQKSPRLFLCRTARGAGDSRDPGVHFHSVFLEAARGGSAGAMRRQSAGDHGRVAAICQPAKRQRAGAARLSIGHL